MADPSEYATVVNENLKATVLNLNPMMIGRSKKHGAHMRAFWASTVSFFLAFVGWFALAPVALEVCHSIEICENQLFEPVENPKRKAFLKFKNIKNGKMFCQYGKVGEDKSPTDCKDVPTADWEANCDSGVDQELCKVDATGTVDADKCPEKCRKYNFDVLPKCVCTPGTHCSSTILYSSLGSVGVTIFVRVALGTLLERFGPVNVQCILMTFGSFWVFMSALISADWNFILIRTFIGCAGATFVTNQFWCSLMFAPNVVGTANATAAGWGNLGGGVTQIFIVWCLFKPMTSSGIDANTAWRASMIVPACLFLVVAATMKMFCWDTPTKPRFETSDTGKTSKASLWDYAECLKDFRVVVMIFQYGACFGTELAMNAQLATHFRVYFQMEAGSASALAGCFGLMNLFARSLGGIFSDFLFKRYAFPGRIWAQFLCLFFEGVFLVGFAFVDNTNEWYVALIVLLGFSTFVQMTEGTSYGIVPFMIPKQLACVSALVGAGGNLGAVIAIWCFYKQLGPIDTLLPFKIHGVYVIVNALLTPVFYWPDKGGMFRGPVATKVPSEASKGEETPPQAQA
jgi:NNP family nitrate/nitrite transporter-like MFS transporter